MYQYHSFPSLVSVMNAAIFVRHSRCMIITRNRHWFNVVIAQYQANLCFLIDFIVYFTQSFSQNFMTFCYSYGHFTELAFVRWIHSTLTKRQWKNEYNVQHTYWFADFLFNKFCEINHIEIQKKMKWLKLWSFFLNKFNYRSNYFLKLFLELPSSSKLKTWTFYQNHIWISENRYTVTILLTTSCRNPTALIDSNNFLLRFDTF